MLTEAFGQHPPGAAVAHYPQHGIQKQAVIGGRAAHIPRFTSQLRGELFSRGLAQFISVKSHARKDNCPYALGDFYWIAAKSP